MDLRIISSVLSGWGGRDGAASASGPHPDHRFRDFVESGGPQGAKAAIPQGGTSLRPERAQPPLPDAGGAETKPIDIELIPQVAEGVCACVVEEVEPEDTLQPTDPAEAFAPFGSPSPLHGARTVDPRPEPPSPETGSGEECAQELNTVLPPSASEVPQALVMLENSVPLQVGSQIVSDADPVQRLVLPGLTEDSPISTVVAGRATMPTEQGFAPVSLTKLLADQQESMEADGAVPGVEHISDLSVDAMGYPASPLHPADEDLPAKAGLPQVSSQTFASSGRMFPPIRSPEIATAPAAQADHTWPSVKSLPVDFVSRFHESMPGPAIEAPNLLPENAKGIPDQGRHLSLFHISHQSSLTNPLIAPETEGVTARGATRFLPSPNAPIPKTTPADLPLLSGQAGSDVDFHIRTLPSQTSATARPHTEIPAIRGETTPSPSRDLPLLMPWTSDTSRRTDPQNPVSALSTSGLPASDTSMTRSAQVRVEQGAGLAPGKPTFRINARDTDPAEDAGLPLSLRPSLTLPAQTGSISTVLQTHSPEPNRQLAAAITQTDPDRGETELTLAPEELGRVRFGIRNIDGQVTITIIAERPETQALLRRNAEMLAADLAQSGMGDATLDFGGGGRDRGDRAPFGQEAIRGQPGYATQSDMPVAAAIRLAYTSNGRLDLRL